MISLMDLDRVLRASKEDVKDFKELKSYVISLKKGGSIIVSDSGKVQAQGSPERVKEINALLELVKKD